MGNHSSRGLGIVWVSASHEIFEEPHDFRMVVFFYTFFRTMGIYSSHTLGIAWISASREIFKKHITFECLRFPIFLAYHANSFSPCFGN